MMAAMQRPSYAPVHPHEQARLASCRACEASVMARADRHEALRLLDQFCALAAAHFCVPTCLINLVEHDVQHSIGTHGLPPNMRDLPRAVCFCTHTIMPDGPDVFEVADASRSELFHNNPVVTGMPFVKLYAGTPLTVDGHRIGALCIMSDCARALTDGERADLLVASAVVVATLKAIAAGQLFEPIAAWKVVAETSAGKPRRDAYPVSPDWSPTALASSAAAKSLPPPPRPAATFASGAVHI